MYHIKNDKRCVRSADTIADALERLIEVKEYNDITISDIQRESLVGRSTFYRLFDTVDDVVLYRIDKIMEELLQDYSDMSDREFVKEYLKLIVSRGGIWLKVASSNMFDFIVKSTGKSLRTRLAGSTPVDETNLEMRLAIFVGSAVSTIVVWKEQGSKKDLDELTEDLFKYLNFDALTEGFE